MNKKSIIVFLITLWLALNAVAQDTTILIDKGEKWFGGAVNEGEKMPFAGNYKLNLNGDARGNQAAPLLLSSKGRFAWSEQPFMFAIKNDTLVFTKTRSPIQLNKNGSTLRSAYLAASKKYFPASGRLPDTLLVTSPQYNTWIELIYDQNQADILKYAHAVIDNGFPPGVLMIDDNWAPYYGRFEFRKDRFPDAKAMLDELHKLGFKVMLWICPFINPSSEESRFLVEKKFVLMNNEGKKEMRWADATKPAIVEWWNGFSAVMDFSNPAAIDWFQRQLDKLTALGVDGYKFDAGDPEYYEGNVVAYKNITSNEHCESWGALGLKYPLNEYRAMWKMGGQPLVERLRDKRHTWADLQKLIPGMVAAGLLGYPFACPDMIGGGDFSSFIKNKTLDQDLIVRSAQCQALMPMMQFSVAPWRILDELHLSAVKRVVITRQKLLPEIMNLVRQSALTGEPAVRSMEYVFPNSGLENCRDQFMLGDSILVAPMLEKGNKRKVIFPGGKWENEKRGIFSKGTVLVDVPLDELLWFKRI